MIRLRPCAAALLVLLSLTACRGEAPTPDDPVEAAAADAAAEITMDLAERYAAFAKAERILMDDVATIPLFWTVQAGLVAPTISDYRPTPRGFPRSRWASFGR